MEKALRWRMHQHLIPIGLVGTIYYGHALVRRLLSTDPNETQLIPATLPAVVVPLVIAILAWRGRLSAHWSHVWFSILVGAAAIETLGWVYLSPNPEETLSVSIFVLALGMLALSVWVWAPFLLLIVGSWLCSMLWLAPDAGLDQHVHVLIAAVALSVLVFGLRLRTLRQLEHERIERTRHAEASEQAADTARRSEQRFRALFLHSPDAVLVVGEDERILDANDAAAQLCGLEHQSLFGKRMLDFVPESQRRDAGRALSCLVTGTRQHAECEWDTGDRWTTVVELRASRIDYDRRRALLVHLRDVSERKQIENRMRRERDVLDGIMNTVMNGILLVAPDGRVNFANVGAEQIVGVRTGDVVGMMPGAKNRSFTDFEGRSIPDRQLPFRQVLRSGQAVAETRMNVATWDGRGVSVSVNAAPLHDDRGEIEAVVLSIHDVSTERRIEAELRERAEFESLVARLSTTFISLTPDRIGQGINESLAAIGRFAGVDRSYIVQFSADHAQAGKTHEWCAPGVEPTMHRMRNVRTDDRAWTMERHMRGEVVHLPRVEDLPPEAQAERREFEAQSIRSLITVPLQLGDSVIGFVGFDSVHGHKTWGDGTIALLRIVGEMFVNALQRQRADRALRDSERRYRQIADVRKKLLEELNHRVKNNIAGLNSLVNLYARSARSVDEFAEAVSGKLAAMRTVHEIITAAGWQTIDLGTLITDLAHQFLDRDTHEPLPELDGPPLQVGARQAAPMAMIVQELLTNHFKHGGRCENGGSPIRVGWRVIGEHDDCCDVRITWREYGSEPIRAPREWGVGLRLIEGFAGFELGGDCRFSFEPTGLRCVLHCRLDADQNSPAPAELAAT